MMERAREMILLSAVLLHSLILVCIVKKKMNGQLWVARKSLPLLETASYQSRYRLSVLVIPRHIFRACRENGSLVNFKCTGMLPAITDNQRKLTFEPLRSPYGVGQLWGNLATSRHIPVWAQDYTKFTTPGAHDKNEIYIQPTSHYPLHERIDTETTGCQA